MADKKNADKKDGEKKDLGDPVKKLQECEASMEVQNKTIEALQKENEELKDKITTFVEENDGLIEKNKEYETLIAEKNQMIHTLQKENAELNKPVQSAALNIKGFLLDVDDPFAAGTLRHYLSISKTKRAQKEILPFVLPYNDPATIPTLKNYFVRADGGGDKERSKAADLALKKLENIKTK